MEIVSESISSFDFDEWSEQSIQFSRDRIENGAMLIRLRQQRIVKHFVSSRRR